MAELTAELQEKVQKLSMIEQQMTSFLSQKQTFQAQLMEIDSALEALEKTDKAYRIIGNVMVASDKPALKVDLMHKRETAELRLKSLENQEEKLRSKATELQNEVFNRMQKKQ
ncbi:prefoldin subunit [Candidatus Woesearchaeota archaeon]|nr:prefoldin subunit [Candidatus Woesearchaeota archaeon]